MNKDTILKKKKVLFIGGSLNQTTIMHQISKYFYREECWFSHFYGDNYLDTLSEKGMLDFCILGGKFKKDTQDYLDKHNLRQDHKGLKNNYDMVFIGTDLIVPRNARGSKLMLVQEGMTNPEDFRYYMVKWFGLPRFLADTSITGLSHAYDRFFVASEGYRDLFIKKGVAAERISVTGIPNFDNAARFLNNDFPHHNFVLVATSDTRETFNYENRKQFIQKAVRIAAGRQLIFKLHPNENKERAIREINKHAPDALVFPSGNINEMIANCDVLITRFSSVVYIGIALGKEVHSDFNLDHLKKLSPIQNAGQSSEKIAAISREILYKERKIHALTGLSSKKVSAL